MSTAALSEPHSASDLPALPQPLLDLRRSRSDQDIAGAMGSLMTSAGQGLTADSPHPSVRSATLPGGESNSRTITHVYEPVRDAQNEVIDFRLTFDQASADASRRPFLGIQMVRTGDWAAPGAIFHTLKRVLTSGQSVHEMTRHAGADQEVCFYQTANRVGDTVVTTTSIVVMVPR